MSARSAKSPAGETLASKVFDSWKYVKLVNKCISWWKNSFEYPSRDERIRWWRYYNLVLDIVTELDPWLLDNFTGVPPGISVKGTLAWFITWLPKRAFAASWVERIFMTWGSGTAGRRIRRICDSIGGNWPISDQRNRRIRTGNFFWYTICVNHYFRLMNFNIRSQNGYKFLMTLIKLNENKLIGVIFFENKLLLQPDVVFDSESNSSRNYAL